LKRSISFPIRFEFCQQGKQRLLPANFRLRIDGLDCSRVSRIDPLTITHQLISGAVGEQREYESEAGYLQTPNLAITLSEVGSETFRQWHEDFVIKGKNGSNMAKNGTLEYLDLKFTVLFTLTFRRLGIFKLTRERSGGENVPRLRAEMYCEEIGFQYETSAVSEKGAGAATAPASAATPTPYSSTAVVTPVSVQPFTEDAAYKEQKAALSPDLVAAPLRLGRPLRFRS